jgi:hypothetical protein
MGKIIKSFWMITPIPQKQRNQSQGDTQLNSPEDSGEGKHSRRHSIDQLGDGAGQDRGQKDPEPKKS